MESFKDAAKEGPMHWCWCCDKLWLKLSLSYINQLWKQRD
jgi:hypothetical protein